MKLWILGVRGLLGSALHNLCNERLIESVGTSREVDISHLEQLKKFSHSKGAEGITHIINCAGYTDVDGAEKESELAFLVNALGPENIGLLAHEMNVKVLHVSTDYVFGQGGDRPFVETDSCTPACIYATSKWQGEQNLLDTCPSACILRTSWLFGPKGKNFISSLLQKMQKETVLKVVSDQRGKPTFVRDLAEAILSLLCHSGIYHFANSGETSRFEMAKQVHKYALEREVSLQCQEIRPVPSSTFPTPAKRPSYSVLNTDKITGILGEPPRHWETAFAENFHALL